ncbi:MAG: TonB-dependent receptor [Steroidobacteraceae bacterium]|nr:TonB-dependent receptor [Steroidobacteraceae bacterium]
MRPTLKLAASSVLALVSFSAHADDTVVVTATRTEEPLAQVGRSVSVIDAETIARRQSDAVTDLLRNLPGITVTRNGGIGTSTSVHIRGAESEQTVVLIDGVKLNDPSAPGGGFNFGNLLVGNIAHVEVLRGSQSVLWGSEAIGGVINLTTLEPTDELAANARAEYGWRSTREIVGNVSQKFGRVSASVGAGEFRTDGISALSERRGGTERDGFRNFGANAKFNIALSDTVSIDLRGWYANGRVGIDGFPPPDFDLADTREYSRTRELVSYSALNAALLEGRFQNRVAVAYTHTDRENIDPDAFITQTFDATGRNTRFEYQGTLEITEALRATFGAESERSRFTSASFGGPPTRGEARIDSAYLQLIAEPVEGLTATAGARHDDHDMFGGKTTAAASAAWTPNAGATVLRASFSEGFKAPTLYQLQSEYGNMLLRPESARSWEAGITQRLFGDTFEINATAFRRDARDLINFVSCFAPLVGICTDRPFGTYDNVARARAEGVELSMLLRPIEALSLEANLTHLSAEDRSPASPTYGNELVRRPQDTFSALVDYRWPFGLETGITYTHVGRAFDDPANTQRIDAYDLVDLRLAYALTETVELQGRIENLLDEQYETVPRYGMPGRAAYVGVRFAY